MNSSDEKAQSSDILNELTALTEGLINISDSESPVIAIHCKSDSNTQLTSEFVANTFNHVFLANGDAFAGSSRVVEEDSVDLSKQQVTESDPLRFLSNRSEIDPNAGEFMTKIQTQWKAVENLLTTNLNDLKFFRFGNTEITFVVIGSIAGANECVGIMCGAVE